MRVSLHPQEAETGLVPSVQDFDKKLAEADAYLQILIDQLKVGLDTVTSPVWPFSHFSVEMFPRRFPMAT